MTPLGQKLYRLASQGYTAREAAAVLGTKRTRATSYGSRYGFYFMPEAELTVLRVQEAASEGLTATEAARRLGMDRSALCRLARERGIVLRKWHNAATVEQAAAAAAREEAERMARWREAWAAKKAAAKLAPAPEPPRPAMQRPRNEAELGAMMQAVAQQDAMAHRARAWVA